jgi:hypothetical protein
VKATEDGGLVATAVVAVLENDGGMVRTMRLI